MSLNLGFFKLVWAKHPFHFFNICEYPLGNHGFQGVYVAVGIPESRL